MNSGNVLCVVDRIALRSGQRTIISEGSWSLYRGEAVALIGPSGSGKTLVAQTILGLNQATAPAIAVDSSIRWPSAPRRDLVIGYVPQGTAGHLHPYLAVGRQVRELTAAAQRNSGGRPDRELVEVLSSLRFPDPERILNSYPHELSGGMRQRVLLAIAIQSKPALLVLDEPTTALDAVARAAVYRELERLQASLGTAIFLITHDRAEAIALASRILEIRDSRIAEVTHEVAEERQRRRANLEPGLGIAGGHRAARSAAEASLALDVRELSVQPMKFVAAPKTSGFAVRNVSFSLLKGKVLGIVGETGSGKTTLLRGLVQLGGVLSGRVQLGAVFLNELPPLELRKQRRKFQVLFQDAQLGLNPFFSVKELFIEPAKLHGYALPSHEAICETLSKLGLPRDVLSRKALELSYGQKQRVAVGRILAGFPELEVLVMDEPFTGLDLESKAKMVEILRKYQAKGGATILASHDLPLVDALADQIMLIKDGYVVEVVSGGISEFRSDYGRWFQDAAATLTVVL
jgi:peptide/nickel transport system ATP-binding protein